MMIKRVTAGIAICGIAWWLLGDTVAHYTHRSQPDGVIRFAHYGSYRDFENWKRVIEAFEQSHAGVRIRQEYIPGYGTQYDHKIRRQLLAGVAPDVFMVQDESFPHYAGTSLADLTDVIEEGALRRLRDDFHPTATASFQHNDAPYALPLYGGNLLIYVNMKCVERAPALAGQAVSLAEQLRDDWTIDEFRSCCRQLTCDFDGDGRTDQYGLWHPWWGYYLPFVWSHGAAVLDESRTEWRLTGPAARDAMQFYRDLLLADRVCPAPGELGQMRQDIAFLSGRVAMVINGPWFIPMLEESELRDHYRVLHMPSGPGGRFTRVTWDGIAINRHADESRLHHAAEFLLFTTSRKAQDLFAQSRRVIPARLDAAAELAQAKSGSGTEKFITSFDYLRVQPITAHWKPMDRAIKRHLRDLLSDRVTSTQFLADLKDDPDISTHFAPSPKRRVGAALP
ncbi:MAG: sugar ABC transporter substrate-binding protein [Planctomycetes bacterium]|nr:sugar ABC transporter substrate-binding protein [Planctomycetota bacterium]